MKLKKIFCLALSLVFSFFLTSSALTKNSFAASTTWKSKYYNVSSSKLYNQCSNWWSFKSGGKTYTSCGNGCSITAFATAYSIVRTKISPLSAAKVAKAKGYWNLIGDAPTNIVPRLASYGRASLVSISKNVNTIMTYLKNGYVIVIRGRGSKPFRPGGHYFVIYAGSRTINTVTTTSLRGRQTTKTTYTNNKFCINDPGDSSTRGRCYDAATMLSKGSNTNVWAMK